MADIAYSRTFQHLDWIDNEDVVQAEGEKGFNQKFHDLEAELDKISTVVGAIKNALTNIQELADGAVTTSKIADGAVTNAKLRENAVARANIQNGAVSLGKIAFQQVNTGRVTVPPRGQEIKDEVVQRNVPSTEAVVYFPMVTIAGSTPGGEIKHVEVTMVYRQTNQSGVDVLIRFHNRGNLPAEVIWVVNTFAT